MSQQSTTGKRKRSPDEDEDEEELSKATSWQGQGKKKRKTTDLKLKDEENKLRERLFQLLAEEKKSLAEEKKTWAKTLGEEKQSLAEEKKTWAKTLAEEKKTWAKTLGEEKQSWAEEKRTWTNAFAEEKQTWTDRWEEAKRRIASLESQLRESGERVRNAERSARGREAHAAVVDKLSAELASLNESRKASASTSSSLKKIYHHWRIESVTKLPLQADTRSEDETKAEEESGQAVINECAGELAKKREDVKKGEALQERVLQEIFSKMLAKLLEDCEGRKFVDYHARLSVTGGSKPDGLVLVNSKEMETVRSIVMNFEFKKGIHCSFTADEKAQTILVAQHVLENSPLARSVCSVLMNERYMVLFRVNEDGTTAETSPLDCRWTWKITEGEERGAEALAVKEARKELVNLMHRPLEDLGHYTVAGSENFEKLLGKGGSGRVYRAVGGGSVYKVFDGDAKHDHRAEELCALQSIARLKDRLGFIRKQVKKNEDELKRIGQVAGGPAEEGLAERLRLNITELRRKRDLLERGLASLPVLQECAVEGAVKMNYAGERVHASTIILKGGLEPWFCQAVDALEVLHNWVQRVHGDVRPPNLLVADVGMVQMRMTLVDFAFSAPIGATPRVQPHDFTYECDTFNADPKDDLVSLVLVYIFLTVPQLALPVDWQPLLEGRFKKLYVMALARDYDGLRERWGGGLQGETGTP